MEVTVSTVRTFVFILGPLVLVSYVAGILRADDPEALWGGIGARERMAIVPFMFVAAAGFLTVVYLLFWSWNAEQIAALDWPWRSSDGSGSDGDGNGAGRLLAAYALYLIPSALWLESTLLHLRIGASWTQALTIGVLTLVSVGLLLMLLLGASAIKSGLPGAPWFVVGVVAMMVQSTLNDNIIWVWKFPW